MWKILSISFQTRQSSSTIFYSPKSISISSPHLLLRNCSKALLSLSFPLPHCYTIMYYFLRLCTTILQSRTKYILYSPPQLMCQDINSISSCRFLTHFLRPLYRFPVLRGQERVLVHLHTHTRHCPPKGQPLLQSAIEFKFFLSFPKSSNRFGYPVIRANEGSLLSLVSHFSKVCA